MNNRSRSRQLLLWPLLTVVGAYLAGIVVGGLLLAVLSANTASDDSWASLGNFILSLLVGFCVAIISWVVGLVWVARRLFEPGNRSGVILSSVAAVVATATATRLEVGMLAGTGAPLAVSALLVLLVLAVPSVVFLLWGRRAGPVSGGPTWVDAQSGSGTRPSDQAVAPPSGFRGPTEWHPEE